MPVAVREAIKGMRQDLRQERSSKERLDRNSRERLDRNSRERITGTPRAGASARTQESSRGPAVQSQPPPPQQQRTCRASFRQPPGSSADGGGGGSCSARVDGGTAPQTTPRKAVLSPPTAEEEAQMGAWTANANPHPLRRVTDAPWRRSSGHGRHWAWCGGEEAEKTPS